MADDSKETTEFRACDATGMCSALHARTDDPGSRRRGFRAIHTVDPTALVGNVTTRFMGVAFHQDARDRGLLINRCPWCGGHPGYWRPQGQEVDRG